MSETLLQTNSVLKSGGGRRGGSVQAVAHHPELNPKTLSRGCLKSCPGADDCEFLEAAEGRGKNECHVSELGSVDFQELGGFSVGEAYMVVYSWSLQLYVGL